MLLFKFFFETVSFCPDWPQTHYIAKDGLDSPVFSLKLDQQEGSTIPDFPAGDLTELVVLRAGEMA